MMVATILVLLMQAGFCNLETGLVRAKNSINVAVKNLLDFCLASVVFVVVGFGIAFGPSIGGVVGFWPHLADHLTGEQWALLGFQLMFCSTAATIVSGAIAERVGTFSYLGLTALNACLLYPVCAHWIWGGLLHPESPGWLQAMGFIDLAGGTVVHVVGGTIALVAVARVGPRIGRFDGPTGIEPHNLNTAVHGTFLLTVGWLGFNGGSFLRLSEDVPRAIVTTLLGGAAGGLATTLWTGIRGRPPVTAVILGLLTGLVAVTPGVHMLEPAEACLLASGAALLALWADGLMVRLRLDDAVSAVPIHLVGGIVGTLGLALLGEAPNLVAGDRLQQLGVQALGLGAVVSYVAVGTYLGYGAIALVAPPRVSQRDEEMGLNVSEHGADVALLQLLTAMRQHHEQGQFDSPVKLDPHTEVGQVAAHYNAVLSRVQLDTQELQKVIEEARQATEAMQHARAGQDATLVELAEWNRLAVDRELRMVELKEEVNALLDQLGGAPRYVLGDAAAEAGGARLGGRLDERFDGPGQ